jgi:hypothetical protein
MGSLALAMLGIIALAPVLAGLLQPVVVPVYKFLGADPAMFAGTILASDMGGGSLAAEMTTDPQEEFSEMTQLHSAKVVSDVELRRLKYPNETPEEAQKVIDEIKASQPDPFEEMFPVEPFGGSDKEDQGGGGNE